MNGVEPEDAGPEWVAVSVLHRRLFVRRKRILPLPLPLPLLFLLPPPFRLDGGFLGRAPFLSRRFSLRRHFLSFMLSQIGDFLLMQPRFNSTLRFDSVFRRDLCQ